ncbi:MAG: methylmalonyl-CoA mutase family protein [Halobacteriota archaeon]|nr:methylmalonyl-CoA mutase family protein [Halobacteriota archaeon]
MLDMEGERREKFLTVSGREIKRVYTSEDVKDLDYEREIGGPGEYPFIRGVHPTMYRGRLWTMRQFSGFGTAEDTNQRYKYLIKHGQTGLSVAFDFPTLYGRDSDDQLSLGEVGRCGVAIDSLKDMEVLFDGIPLDEISTSMTINGPASVLLAMYIVLAEKQAVPLDKISGTIQNDILKEYIAQNSWIFPPKPSVRLITDVMEYCAEHVPKWNTISISGYHIREAGATALQELAFTLADGMAYVIAGMEAGLDVDRFASRLSFFFNSHSDLFEEIAKFRAARRIWAKFMKEEINAKDPRSWMLRFHTQTAGCSLTAQQPYGNIIRTTIEAMAAVLGGTQSLHTNSMDEALALPSEEAVTIALRTQQIIACESGITNTVDPLGGSYFIEYLTSKMEEEAYEYFDRIRDMGDGDILKGVISGIEKGFFQRDIADSAYIYQKELEDERQIVVGVNRYVTQEEIPIEIFNVDPKVEELQIRRTRELKRDRDDEKVHEALYELQRAAESDENLMPFIIEAVKAYATLGEIIKTLKEVFGEYKELVVF